MNVYLLLAVGAMVGYGVTAMFYKLADKGTDAVSVALISSVASLVTVFIYWLFTRDRHVDPIDVGYAVTDGVLGTSAPVAFVASVQLGKVSIAATLRGLSFLVTTVVAVLFLAEKISLIKAVGIALAAVALVLLSL